MPHPRELPHGAKGVGGGGGGGEWGLLDLTDTLDSLTTYDLHSIPEIGSLLCFKIKCTQAYPSPDFISGQGPQMPATNSAVVIDLYHG